MKGLDHIVWCVDDLDGASRHFTELGFKVAPRACHPFGTHNCVIQLNGFFLELLTVAEPEKITPPDKSGFSFAYFNQQFLMRKQGISMLVLDSDDFRADHERTQKAGLETYPPFEFSRMTTLPDGSSRKVSFGLNFNTSPNIPDAAFFTCQQFQPEYFWSADYQRHANGATGINEVGIVASDPEILRKFLQGFTSCPVLTRDDGIRVSTSRGDIAVYTPNGYARRYKKTIAPAANEAHIAGIAIGMKEISVAKPESINVYGADILFEPLG